MQQFTDKQFGDGAMKPSDIAAGTLRCYEAAGLKDQLPDDIGATVQGIRDAEDRAHQEGSAAWRTMESLWQNNETLRLGIPDLQKRLQETPLTADESRRIGECVEKTLPAALQQVGGVPDAAVQRATGECFRGTPYEQLVTPMYEKIAMVIDCARDKLGFDRLKDAATTGAPPNDKEVAIITQCYIERTAPVVTAASVVSVVAFGGLRTIALSCYLGFSNIWAVVRRRRGERAVRVMSSLRNAPIDLAIVRLLDAEHNSTKRSVVSDTRGSCFLSAPAGTYTVEVSKPGCTFPSAHTTAQSETLGVAVTLTDADPVVRGVAAVDETVADVSVRREQWRRWGRRIASFITWTAPLIGIGAAIASPKWWVIILAALNVVLVVTFQVLARRLRPKSLGVVRAPNGKPVGNTIVRLFDLQYNKLLAAAVTDGSGRYGLAAGAGTYELRAEKSDVGTHVQRVTVSDREPVVAVDLTLTPVQR